MSKMEFFVKIVHDFQLLTIFAVKAFSLLDIWRASEYVSNDYISGPSFQKSYVPFSYTSYLYQHSIDSRINLAGNKYQWTQKWGHVDIFILYFTIYLRYVIIWNLFSLTLK